MSRQKKNSGQGSQGYVLGVDIAKRSFAAALADAGGKVLETKQLDNDETGFKALRKWMQQHKARQVHACMEAAGRYGDALAYYLYAQGYTVSVVDPARIEAYAQSQLPRDQTDSDDARLIAGFCATQQPERWTPPADERTELYDLTHHLHMLKQMRQKQHNRLDSAVRPMAPGVRRSLETSIAVFDAEIAKFEAIIDDYPDSQPTLEQQDDLIDSVPMQE